MAAPGGCAGGCAIGAPGGCAVAAPGGCAMAAPGGCVMAWLVGCGGLFGCGGLLFGCGVFTLSIGCGGAALAGWGGTPALGWPIG
jgi:hypothetical protein